MKLLKQVFLTAEGNVIVEEVEYPTIKLGRIIVKTEYSLISSGTERELILSRKKHPGEKKIPLGYSASGKVVEVVEDIGNIEIGDKVACSGIGFASHSQYMSVPQNLFVKIPKNLSTKEAATITLGCIAIHAVRQSKTNFGEYVVVIGLGLVGQIVSQIALCAGLNVIATDMNNFRVNKAVSLGVNNAILDKGDEVDKKVRDLTHGYGADAVLICAHSKSPHLVDRAVNYVRDRGRIVIVGNFPLTITRESFFQKEIELTISRAYGPGRYDKKYEEEGIDYPYSYVRWTENRNMQEFIALLHEKRIDVLGLISHEYNINECNIAYEKITNTSSNSLGVLFKY